MVAMFISADYPEAERITPSSGDGGIDVLVKTDKTRVYQVKKFTDPLTDKQKKQVEKSVDALVTDPRVKDMQVDEWHLVMPWDATLEAKKWLTDYVTAKGLPEPIWDGLVRCDLWASQHPNIVDYYLGGNAARIREMALSIVQGLRLKNIREEAVQSWGVSGFADELKETAEVLNREDPFYYYGIHVEPQLKAPGREDIGEALRNIKPGIVLSTLIGDGRMSVQVDVYVKNRVALDLNPLKINFTTTVKPGSDEATALQDFLKFGSPMELPTGSISGSSALPGGLGGKFENAGVSVFPTGDIAEGERELRLVLFDMEDQQLDSLVIHRQYTTIGTPTDQGPRGIESRLTDVHSILDVILRFDVDEQTSKLATIIHNPSGKLAVDVFPALRFYYKMKAPNTLAVAPRFGPIPDVRNPLRERSGTSADLMYDVAEALSLIQQHTPHRLHFPDFAEVEEGLIRQILKTGALLKGQTLTLSTGYLATEHDPEVSDDAETTVMLMPWKVTLQEGVVDLGYLAHAFSGSFYKRADEGPDGLYDIWSVDDGKVLLRMLSEDEQRALPDIS